MNNNIKENIEDRIKNIISLKFKKDINFDFDNELNEEKMELIEKLFEIFPDLKDEKKYIYDSIKKKDNYHFISNEISNEVLLEEFLYNDIVYYKDKFGVIWDKDAKIIGSIKTINENGKQICFFFNTNYNVNLNIDDILKK